MGNKLYNRIPDKPTPEEIERTKRKELAEVKANIFKDFLSKF